MQQWQMKQRAKVEAVKCFSQLIYGHCVLIFYQNCSKYFYLFLMPMIWVFFLHAVMQWTHWPACTTMWRRRLMSLCRGPTCHWNIWSICCNSERCRDTSCRCIIITGHQICSDECNLLWKYIRLDNGHYSQLVSQSVSSWNHFGLIVVTDCFKTYKSSKRDKHIIKSEQNIFYIYFISPVPADATVV